MLISGAFWRQFSIAVWPLAWSPWVSWLHTNEASPSLIPKPWRKPSWRNLPTVIPGARSRVAIFADLLPNAALAYWPMNTPAFRLSVANSASVASWGSVGVSRAMTITPLSRAFLIAGTIPLVSLGVIRMPFTPAVTMFSMAVTWPALSPSNLPAAVMRSRPSSVALACAPSFIFTKKGLVSVLVIRPTLTLVADEPELELLPPQAATKTVAAMIKAIGAQRRRPPGSWSRVRVLDIA